MSTIRATLQAPWVTRPRRASAEAAPPAASDGLVDALMKGLSPGLGFWEGRRSLSTLKKMARLIGDSSVAAAEMKLLLREAPAHQKPSEFLKPYVDLLGASEGLDPAAVRQSFLRLQHPADPQLPQVYRGLLEAWRGRAVPALGHLDWLERNTAPGKQRLETAALFSGLVALDPEVSAEEFQALVPRVQKLGGPGALALLERQLQRDVPLQKGVAKLEELQSGLGPGESLAAALDRLLEPSPVEAPEPPPAAPAEPAPDLELARLEELCGSPRAAAEEMQILRSAVPQGQDPKAFLARYLSLLEAADGVELEDVRKAFLLLEQEADQGPTFRQLLEGTGRSASASLRHLEWIRRERRDPHQAVELVARLHRALPELDGRKAVPSLASLCDPLTAVDRLQSLLHLDVPLAQALADLQFLETTPAAVQGEAFGYLCSLRALVPREGSVHDGLKVVLAPSQASARQELSSRYRQLLERRPEPALALEDLRWLVQEHLDGADYVKLLEAVPPSGQTQLREWYPRLRGDRQAVFLSLYDIERNPAVALQDLESLENRRPAGRTLEQALREFRSLARSRYAHRTDQVRDSYALLAAPPAYFEPDAFGKELLQWAAEAEDLELGRQLLAPLTACKSREEYRELKERFAQFLSEGRDKGDRTRALVAAVGGVAPEGFAALEPTLREMAGVHTMEQTARILEETRATVDKFRLPRLSRTAQFQQFLEILRQADGESDFKAVDRFLTAHSTSLEAAAKALGVLAPVVGGVGAAVEEHRFLEEQAAAALPDVAAYAKLYRVLREKSPSSARSLAQESLAWAAGQSRMQLAGVPLSGILDQIAALLVPGGSLDDVKAAVVDLLSGRGRIEVGQTYVDVSGVRVRRKEGAP